MPHLQLLNNPPAVPVPPIVEKKELPSKEVVTELLTEAGIASKRGGIKKSIKELLDEYDIGTENAIELLSDIARRGESDAIRLRAIDTALKLSGDLTETVQVPVVNIIINDKESDFVINPILIPR